MGRETGHGCRRGRLRLRQLILVAALLGLAGPALGQDAPAPDEGVPAVPEKVDVQPRARDAQIAQRLQEILEATEWFEAPAVRVQDGVVFLEGETDTQDYKEWAGNLARSTQDVAAVVNRIELAQRSPWDLEPALVGLRDLWRGIVRALPLLVFSALVLVVAGLFALAAAAVTRWSLRRRAVAPFLRSVLARAAGAVFFVLGLYVVLRIAGLTATALTVMGGTGLIGIALGFAFRGVTENFLASVFLSTQPPFRNGDLVEIAPHVGFVQRLTSRATVLMTLDGNHVQIPNAAVYQATIRNFSSNPNRREDFTIGIGYDDVIPAAQAVARKVISEHPAVLADPEPWVLVDALGAATVTLRVYFWLDGSAHSWLKVKSSVIRQVKRAFQDAGISMPDEARELVFPKPVPVQMLAPVDEAQPPSAADRAPEAQESAAIAAEGGLGSEAGEIEQQARRSRTPEEGEDLLSPPPEA